MATMMKSPYKLILFDLDGTLAPFDSDTLYPDAAQWLANETYHAWMIVTNQGGVGLRYWMEKDGFGEPEKYPTLEDVTKRIDNLFPAMPANEQDSSVLMCVRYQSKKSGEWCPVPDKGGWMSIWRKDWRKPAPGMLLHAMVVKGYEVDVTLMVGDSAEDEQAAQAAGCAFMWAWDFFGRDKPKGKEQS